METEQADSM
jgi:hypothetical protein